MCQVREASVMQNNLGVHALDHSSDSDRILFWDGFLPVQAMVLAALMINAPVAFGEESTLGHFPLCEASAALIIDCPDRSGSCLLVGDNEQRSDLFLFDLSNGTPDPGSQRRLHLSLDKGEKLSDIEALAPLADGSVLVMASQSRNTKCEAKKNRRRWIEVRLSVTGATVRRQGQSGKIRCDRLFSDIKPGDGRVQAACAAIDQSEQRAILVEDALKQGQLTEEQSKHRCNAITPFNIEGALTIPGHNGTQTWVGLRAPLVLEHPGQPEHQQLAMLLRMKDLLAFTFDQVALLDLGGRGIRDLTFARGQVWLIAGPAGDEEASFELRRFPVDALQKNDIIVPERVQALPAFAEGLAIQDNLAYVVMDGDMGDNSSAKACKRPSRYLRLILK